MINKNFNSYYLLSLGLFFLLAMHYYQVNSGGYGLTIAFNNTSWIAISFIISIALIKLSVERSILLSQSDIVLSIVIFILFIPLLWSSAPWVSTVYDRYFAVFTAFLVVIANRQFSFAAQEKMIFFALISSAALIQAIVGLVQFFLADDQNIIYFRPSGTLQQVNVYASLLATGLAVSIYQLLASHLPKYLKIFHYCMIFFAVLLLGIVLSRVAVLGSLLVTVGLFLLFNKQRKRIAYISLVAIVSVGLTVALKDIKPESNRENIASAGYRSVLYSLSFELIQEKPFLGHGLGRFQSIFLDKQAQFLSDFPEEKIATAASSHPHNEILFWWVEGGLIPVIALFLFAIGFSYWVWSRGDVHKKSLWLCLIPILLHTQTEYPIYQSVPHLFILMLILSLADVSREYRFKFQFFSLSKVAAILVPVVVTAFMVINLHSLWLIEQYAKNKETKYISSIINPFPIKHLVNRAQAESLLKTNSLKSLFLAEFIINEEIALRPSEGAYWLKYRVLLSLGQIDKASVLYQKASFLFPNSTVFNRKKTMN